MPAPTIPTTQIATVDDRDSLAPVLARAFYDDPLLGWIFPDDATRLRHSAAFFRWDLRRLLPLGATWTTPAHDGGALWATPGRWRESFRELLGLSRVMAPALGRRSPTIMRAMTVVEQAHPAEPHLYLGVLGVEPARQGAGVGGALIRPGLLRADGLGVPAYLETAKESNLPFYERHGFTVTREEQLPGGGPRVWFMWREAQSA